MDLTNSTRKNKSCCIQLKRACRTAGRTQALENPSHDPRSLAFPCPLTSYKSGRIRGQQRFNGHPPPLSTAGGGGVGWIPVALVPKGPGHRGDKINHVSIWVRRVALCESEDSLRCPTDSLVGFFRLARHGFGF